MKKLILYIITLLIVCFAALAAYVWSQTEQVNSAQLNNEIAFDLIIAKGTNLYSLKRQLNNYIDVSDISFKIWVKINSDKSQIKAGLYEISARAKLTDIISQINQGKVKQFSLTLLEGHTLKQWLQKLRGTDSLIQDLGADDKLYARFVKSDTDFCANDYQSLEGCFMSNTYFYTYQDSAFALLQRAYDDMQNAVTKAWEQRFTDIPLKTPYEALILASIIEKETAIDAERAEIAGVFANRLDKNMRLQTDPTVIYGVGDAYNGDITKKHLRTPTPYNTYVIKGLPITPIAMLSTASLNAAVQPAITDAYYFVATGDGGHKFSATLQEHNKALRAYLKKMKQKRDKTE